MTATVRQSSNIGNHVLDSKYIIAGSASECVKASSCNLRQVCAALKVCLLKMMKHGLAGFLEDTAENECFNSFAMGITLFAIAPLATQQAQNPRQAARVLMHSATTSRSLAVLQFLAVQVLQRSVSILIHLLSVDLAIHHHPCTSSELGPRRQIHSHRLPVSPQCLHNQRPSLQPFAGLRMSNTLLETESQGQENHDAEGFCTLACCREVCSM